MHSDFTLFLRKYPNGKEVYFYYTYDVNKWLLGFKKREVKVGGKTEVRE